MREKNPLTRRLFVFLALAITLIMASSALAVHDVGLFELDIRDGVDGDQDKRNDPIPATVGDGNTIDEAAPGDDWENVYLGTSSAFATSFAEDTFANNNIDNGAEAFVAERTPEISFFTGGGSKDTNGIQDGPWLYNTVNDVVPDKNDIVNAFAAAYDDPDDGHTIFYFGLDTFSVNGDSNAGFWFFRNRVGLNPLEPGDTTGTFFGEHTDGDIFVAVAYTEGGKVGDIDVYRWQGDDATGSLVQTDTGLDCAEAAPDDDVCGVINKLLPGVTFGEDPIFDYANTLVANNPLDPTSYQYESAALAEFGLDVNAILGEEIGCFTTFLAETRSSQSERAQLKDFAFGEFAICSIAVDKTGPEKSKVGDEANYVITVTNDGRATLHKQSIIDTVFGDLTDGSNPLITSSDCGASLAPGESCTIDVTYTVQMGDPDPLENTVTVTYTEFADPASLEFTDSDDHSVNLFQPSIAFDKSADATLSKEGDTVNYTLTLDNTSSADTPDLNCTISDAVLGINAMVTLASGESHVINQAQVMPAAPDPYVNTASVSCQVDGFPNVLNASDSWTVNLFQPSIAFDKSADASLSKEGDTVNYTLTLDNTSSADSPDLHCTISDAVLGINAMVTLASGESHVINQAQVMPAAPDPYVNTASVSCQVDGFSNVLNASDSWMVNLFQPSIAFDKSADASLSKEGDTVNYTLTLDNTSSADSPDLHCTISDAVLGINAMVTLASGESHVINQAQVMPAAPDPYVNTASVSCQVDGFPNVLNASDSWTVNLFQPSVTIDKSGDDLSKVGDPVDYVITVTNTSSTDSPNLTCTISDPLLGINKMVNLASGEVDVTNATRIVQMGDPDPLTNTASVTCGVDGFPNVLGPISDSHTTELFQPDVEVIKTGPDIATRGETITYDFTINNLSSADSPDLILDSVTDTLIGDLTAVAAAAGCDTLASPGGTCMFSADYTIALDDPSPLENVVTVHYHPEDFPNDINDDDDHLVQIPVQGCTPGFWQGGAGSQLWNEPNDPDWEAGNYATQFNPYHHNTLFNDFFNVVTVPRLDGLTMFDLVSSGGGSDSAVRAARDMVAAYLNESAFPDDFPADSLAALEAQWYEAVAGGDDALDAFHELVSGWNDPEPPGFCPLP